MNCLRQFFCCYCKPGMSDEELDRLWGVEQNTYQSPPPPPPPSGSHAGQSLQGAGRGSYIPGKIYGEDHRSKDMDYGLRSAR